jgi:hypothetical protein
MVGMASLKKEAAQALVCCHCRRWKAGKIINYIFEIRNSTCNKK